MFLYRFEVKLIRWLILAVTKSHETLNQSAANLRTTSQPRLILTQRFSGTNTGLTLLNSKLEPRILLRCSR